MCEDDPRILHVLTEALERDGHVCVTARTGTEALAAFTDRADVDVVVLDIGLPDADGRDVCQALRTAGQDAPVLFLTARGALNDLVSGYAVGGDDYVTKPFMVKEVLLRVRALARRRPDGGSNRGDLRLDPRHFSLRRGTEKVRLSPTEYRMLAVLTARPGEVIRRRELVAAAWPDGAYVTENTIDSYIRRVREKLAEVAAEEAIETVRGVGYCLRVGP